MKTFPVIAVLIFLPYHHITAQVIDDFSDGDITMNPSWNGSTSDFIVNSSGQLQLSASVAGKSWLSTDFPVVPDQYTVWEFYVKQSFAPSGANFGRFYLMSDESDLSAPLNGYFLQFGEAGSSDAIELIRQSGTLLTSVCRASAGAIASSFAMRVRVTREGNGRWELLTASDATANFVTEASGTDGVHQTSGFAGVLCTYTITNSTRFYYDDFHFSTADVGDTSPPRVLAAEVLTQRTLQVTFSEDMDSTSVSDLTNYSVQELSMNPQTIEHSDKGSVILSFPADFKNGHQHTLAIQDVADLPGNVMADTAIAFLFFQPSPVQFKDVVLTEILPDPSPTVALPEVEYIELYNRSSAPVELSDWTVSDETSSARLESFILLPGAYVVVSNAPEKFNVLGNLMDASLPSLNNSGDVIKLKDADGVVVDSVAYSQSWYTNDTEDGGWSLELIDPENLCAGSRNWTVSESATGGTPGVENSVKASLPDNMGPVVLSLFPSDSVTVTITLNEALDKQIPSADHFQLEPMRDILSVRFGDPSMTTLTLVLGTPLRRGETYTITIRDVYDCSGNLLHEGVYTSQIVLPQKAEEADVIINEILFNPMPQGVDFVEVFNRSEKVIDLANWSLANPHNHHASNAVKVSETLSIIYPREYRVFTKDVDVLKGEYIAGDEKTFRQMDLPALNDDEGQLVLSDGSGRMIDSVYYSEDYHNPFVRDGEGISLERISPSSTPFGRSNWRSASGAIGFATPGYLNSNARTEVLSQEMVSIEPEVIQPEVASSSFALIKYQFGHGGMMANIKVLDQQGRLIKHIASSELLGTEGFFRWDGDLDDGSAAAVGYYIVWFEIFDADGMVQIMRKRLAIF